MTIKWPIKQICYVVEDMRLAAQEHAAQFGSGPYYILDYLSVPAIRRGQNDVFEHGSAFGQWGAMQIEFIQFKGQETSSIAEVFSAKRLPRGIHHVALFVDDVRSAARSFEENGYETAVQIRMPAIGLSAMFMDLTKTHGHFVELYEPIPAIAGLYNMIAEAAANFDGRDLLREVDLADLGILT